MNMKVQSQEILVKEEYALYPLFNDTSTFVKKRLYLCNCSAGIKHGAVDKAVAACCSILTCYKSLAPDHRPNSPPLLAFKSKKVDHSQGFTLNFVKGEGSLEFERIMSSGAAEDNSNIDNCTVFNLALKLAPNKVTQTIKQRKINHIGGPLLCKAPM